MPKDDAVFAADLDAADQAFRKATEEGLPDWAPVGKVIETRMNAYQHRLYLIGDFGRISSGTQPVIEAFNLRILPRLSQFEPDSNESPVQTIRGKLEGWDGPEGSAAYKFKFGYLNELATALGTQYSVMQSMAAVMSGFEEVIDRARQQFLDILKNATEAIGQGDNWFGVADDALAKMDDALNTAEEEIKEVEKTLDEALVYLTGDFQDRFLPPESVSDMSSGLAPGISSGVAPGISSGVDPDVIPGESSDGGDRIASL
ncbi:hypothetical protein AB0A73_04990 [Glycomyces sp. NPDC047369]